MKIPMPREYKHIRPIDNVWYGKPHYKKSLSVPGISIKYGSISSKIKSMPRYAKYFIGSLIQLKKSVKSIEKNPYLNKNKISEETLSELTEYANSLGINNIGYTKVRERHLFDDSIVLFKNAIVFTMKMNADDIKLAPSKATNKEIFRVYYEMGRSVNLISDFLRSKGYNAQPVAAISSNLNLTLLARDAGLGGFGKHGLLITDEFGPSIRLAAVLTDIENLPFSNKNEFDWIKDFCDSCNACVRKCPANAIYKEPVIFSNGSEKHINYKKCAIPFTKQYGCTVCIKECVFFRSNYDKIKSGYYNRKKLMQK